MRDDWYLFSKYCDNSDFIENRLVQDSESKEMHYLRPDSDFRLKICSYKIIFKIWLAIQVFFLIKILIRKSKNAQSQKRLC